MAMRNPSEHHPGRILVLLSLFNHVKAETEEAIGRLKRIVV
jgi:hypothetical protein